MPQRIGTHNIEASGHKVLTLPQLFGKVSPESAEKYLADYYNDANHEHMVMPGMIYISHPTEHGALLANMVRKMLVCF